MGYRNLQQCIADLEAAGHLVRLASEVDAQLEAAEVHRRVCASGGPAVLFEKVKGCNYPMVSNLFGTIERARFMFRDSLQAVQRAIELKIDPNEFFKRPFRYAGTPWTGLTMLPKKVRRGPVMANEISITDLPQLKSWPNDGGAFVTLPQVYTEDVTSPGLMNSNLGMYRIQISGNQYRPSEEIGLHYQLHRGIGVHQTAALQAGEPFRVNVFVGGTPAMSLAAVMPLPEGMSELTFAGALARRRIPMVHGVTPLPFYGEADFVITGTVDPNKQLPEGPFGDHLGYYSLAHDFPVLKVEKVFARDDAVWPFTIVGRPPQEDSIFGELIHDLTGPIIPTVIPGVHGVNAVDAAGVHPLLLAIGSERYTPYNDVTRPAETLTQANAILGQGQMSLAKYLLIVARDDDPNLNVNDIEPFFGHLLQRVDWKRDLHFHTSTTIDTLDYSGSGLNEGSKVVIAGVGPAVRELPTEIPADLHLPSGFSKPQMVMPGVLAVEGSPENVDAKTFTAGVSSENVLNKFPLVVLVDDSQFTAATLNNFLWITFTRSNPAADVHGVGDFTRNKHWGCEGSLVIDARTKPHHAPPLVEDPEISRRVDALAARGGALSKWL